MTLQNRIYQQRILNEADMNVSPEIGSVVPGGTPTWGQWGDSSKRCPEIRAELASLNHRLNGLENRLAEMRDRCTYENILAYCEGVIDKYPDWIIQSPWHSDSLQVDMPNCMAGQFGVCFSQLESLLSNISNLKTRIADALAQMEQFGCNDRRIGKKPESKGPDTTALTKISKDSIVGGIHGIQGTP